MASKTRGKRKPRLSESQLYHPQVKMVSEGAEAVAQAISVPVSTGADDAALIEEYRYVMTDLKKIAWLAVVMLALLIVLAFVIV